MILIHYIGIACAVALAVTAKSYTVDLDGYLDFTAGYRNDRITTTVQAFDPPDTLRLTDKLKASNISIWDIGVYGRLQVCYDWFIRGFAQFGRVDNGRYRETVELPNGAISISHAKIYGGHTRDYSIGAGYLFRWDYFRLGPAAGWAYDSQRIKIRQGRTGGIDNPILNGLLYKMRWQGPWVGAELVSSLCCIDFRMGYEYHWTHWHADWLLAGPDIIGGAFSDRRKSNRTYGNVVFIDAWYAFFNCIDTGLGIKYQWWNAIRGKEKPRAGRFSRVGLNDTEVDRVPRATWRSFDIHLSLGRSF